MSKTIWGLQCDSRIWLDKVWFGLTHTHIKKRTRSNRILLRPCVANKTDLIENKCSDDAKNVWMKSHQKKQQKQKTKTPKENHQNLEFDKYSLFCVFLVCFFLCALVLYFLNPYILYAVRLKSLVYKKVQNKLLTVIFGSREKEESKMYERKGGQAHPSLEYIFWVSGFDMIRL